MPSVVRGCGTRQPGGIYLVSELGEKGKPLDYFLIDAPRPIDAEKVGLSARGVTLTELAGAPCILDWVGADGYPNVADFLEEVARFGSSRRVQSGLDFSRLGPGSRHLFVHPKAVIENPQEYWDYVPAEGCAYAPDCLPGRVLDDEALGPCVTRRPDHGDEQGMCATLWWHDLHPDSVVYAAEEGIFEAQTLWRASVKRQMPGFAYHAFARPQDTRARYTPGAFLWLPVHRIAVIDDPEGGAHEAALKKASKAGLPVDLEKE
jgi:hypothetical protein